MSEDSAILRSWDENNNKSPSNLWTDCNWDTSLVGKPHYRRKVKEEAHTYAHLTLCASQKASKCR